jgi:hypothetical protein
MTDLFISYAWTSPTHREWVRLLASQLHLLGYDVRIDEQIDYGSSLSGFMQEVTSATHVLLIVDENYVLRTDTMPESGVGIENRWLSGAFNSKPSSWLSIVFVRNPLLKAPAWLSNHTPKGFDFNSRPEVNVFPGSIQIDEIWRWVEGLPAYKGNSTSLAEVRKRASTPNAIRPTMPALRLKVVSPSNTRITAISKLATASTSSRSISAAAHITVFMFTPTAASKRSA